MSRLPTLAALAVAALFAAPAAEARQSLPEGSYADSCQNLYVDGDTLYGECLNSRGKYKKTWISGFQYCEGDIVNSNGVLDCDASVKRDRVPVRARSNENGLPGGTWTSTCSNAVLEGYVLRASCRDDRGTVRPTFLDMRQCNTGVVNNEDGLLVCGAPPPPPAPLIKPLRDTLPGGDWITTCRSAAVRVYQMRGECFTGEAWNVSDIDLSKCRSGNVSNDRGRLVCN